MSGLGALDAGRRGLRSSRAGAVGGAGGWLELPAPAQRGHAAGQAARLWHPTLLADSLLLCAGRRM